MSLRGGPLSFTHQISSVSPPRKRGHDSGTKPAPHLRGSITYAEGVTASSPGLAMRSELP